MDLIIEEARIAEIAVQFMDEVDDGLKLNLTEQLAEFIDEEQQEYVGGKMLDLFDPDVQFQFSDGQNGELTATQSLLERLYSNDLGFLECSRLLAEKLYSVSSHHTVKPCEFFLVRISDLVVDGQMVDAVGLFKTNERQRVLRAANRNGTPELNLISGIDLGRISKGALFFRFSENEPFNAFVSDRLTLDARYWTEDFLGVQRVQDDGFHTGQYLSMCQEFAEEAFPATQDKNSQLKFLNKSLEYFKNNESFEPEEFERQVVGAGAMAGKFQSFSNNYMDDHGYEEVGNFDISVPELKKMQRKIRNLIKLDTEIEIRVRSNNPEINNRYVERGYDDGRGMYFYKVYFNSEA